MRKEFIVAIFDDDETLLKGSQKLKDKNVPIYDIYTPFPVHGLDEVLGIQRSFLPFVTFVAGATGLLVALVLQGWTSAVDWPLNVGGKPFASWPAFIPISFELTVLFAAHTTVGAFLVYNKLFPGQKPIIFDELQTDHHFVVAIEKEKAEKDLVTSIMQEHGAIEVRMQSLEIK